jgi:hypothetical protein
VRVTLGLQQPVMDPLFNTRAAADVLIGLARGDNAMAARYPWANYRDFLRTRYSSGGAAFTEAVAKGLGQGSVLARDTSAAMATTAPAIAGGASSSGRASVAGARRRRKR